MGGSAEQIIAGVVISERLAVTMYGAMHRAQFAGQRNLRGLVLDAKLLAEPSFRAATTDPRYVAPAIALSHASMVPTVAVESDGPSVVVVTRGGGRYVTVQDLISAARANRATSGKLPLPVAAAIGKAVVEALAVAHAAKVVHGAVHPRSVLVDEDGSVRLGDFVVGRALTTAVAQGADSSLWRGLSGYLAPELVVGEEPSPAADVYAVGAMLFTMLSGEVPPGNLHATPAVERLVHRALDTGLDRRYRTASDLLENLLEAFEDDRWDIATPAEVIRAAGLSRPDTNIDEATEDLLASLGSSPGAVQVTPIRPSMDLRAAAVSAQHARTPTGSHNRLDALLADLDDSRVEHTNVEDAPSAFKRDPISELIAANPRRGEAIVQSKRVPSLDDPDDITPLPLPARESDNDLGRARPNTTDESAAMSALDGLDDPPARRRATSGVEIEAPVRTRSHAPTAAATPAAVAERAAPTPPPAARVVRAAPVIDPPEIADLPTPRLRSRIWGVLALIVVLGGAVAFYFVYKSQEESTAAQRERNEAAKRAAEEQTLRATAAQADMGAIHVSSTPSEASVWLKLGRTNVDSMPLTSSQMHRIRVELEGYQAIDTEVTAASWSGTGAAKKATVALTLTAAARDKSGKSLAKPLPALPPNLVEQKGFTAGEGPIHIETTPPGAEVWLLIGYANTGATFPTVAGHAYELRVLADGYLPGYASVTADEWRDGGDPKIPIDMAKKKQTLDKHVDLVVDTAAPPKKAK